MKRTILQSNVNGFLSLLFVGTFTLGAVLIIWQKAFGENPIEHALEHYIVTETQL